MPRSISVDNSFHFFQLLTWFYEEWLTIFEKTSDLNVWQGLECASDENFEYFAEINAFFFKWFWKAQRNEIGPWKLTLLKPTKITLQGFCQNTDIKEYLWMIPSEECQWLQKQPSICVLKKYSEIMRQIYWRIPMPKYDFNKVALQLYWNHTLTWAFFCKFAAYFQNTFS